VWSNFSQGPQLIEVCPGTYSVTVIDAVGCTSVDSVTIAEYPMMNLTVDSFKNASCYGFDNGEAWITASGGIPPYVYDWLNGQTTSHATGLMASSYYPIVTDSKGCIVSNSVNITSPTEIVVTENTYPPICFSSSGFISVSVTGGTPAGMPNPYYSYLWNNSNTTNMNNNLTSGIYYLTVTDSIGCFVTKHYVLNTQDGPTPTITFSNVTCHGQNNGAVTTVSSTAPVATCIWSTGSTSFLPPYPSNLAPGDYWVQVNTPLGCSGFDYFTITEPDSLMDSPMQTNNLCFGDSTGEVYTNVIGGISSQNYPYYNFLWSTGSIDPFISLLPAGSYSVTITDLNGCAINESFNIVDPPQLAIDSFPVTNVSCYGMDDGFVSLFVSGGVSPYYYSIDSINWNPEDTVNWLIPSNNYHVFVKDQNYCLVVTPDFTVSEPQPLNVYASWVDPTCANNDGFITVDSITGGTLPYLITWDTPPYTGNVLTNLSDGLYYLTVTDNHLCENVQPFDLFQIGQLAKLAGINLYNGGNFLPPGDAEIFLFSPGTFGAATMDTVASTINSASVWEFTDLAPGIYYVKAVLTNPAAYPTLLDSYYDNTFQWQFASPIALACDDSVNIIMTMAEIAPITTGNGTLSGTVLMLTGTKSTEAVGEPVPGAEILIEQEPNDIPVQCTLTDSTGKYIFTGLVPGPGYHLIVDIPGFPLLSTYQNITVPTNDTIPNLNFLVDSTLGGGIFIDTASYVSYIPDEGVSVEVFPNPFSTFLNVQFELKEKKSVTIELFDVMGRKVQVLEAGDLLPGNHEFVIKPDKKLDGSCYLIIHTGNTLLVRKLIASPK
jgi:hypothetical protein